MKTYDIYIDAKLISRMKKLAKKDKSLSIAVHKKLTQIADNPYIGKPLHSPLQGYRRVHVGHFVIIFKILEEDQTVILTAFGHHDEAYTR